MQKSLNQDQIEPFYHDNFVKSQVNDFINLTNTIPNCNSGAIIDIGGGYGFFAKELEIQTGSKVRVVDTDLKSIDHCKQQGIDAIFGDALDPIVIGDEGTVCFNLILHHLVGSHDDETYSLQAQAINKWHGKVSAIFINEYIYESFVFENLSGWLIYMITRSALLSGIGKMISRLMPTLSANTFGTGVRFRAQAEWVAIFNSLGFDVVAVSQGKQEGISLPRRLLFIKNCRRDSFLLVPRGEENVKAMNDRR